MWEEEASRQSVTVHDAVLLTYHARCDECPGHFSDIERMVPVSLRLKNFLSYGESAPTLDFESFQIACLSGRNGQGKSALLDAITWALWGEARKSSDARKPDEALLHIGARHMEVELVFDLEGVRYRVFRFYHRTATGKTNKSGLELNVYDPVLDTFRALTGSSIRETQEQLQALLGLDYNTFINSAFLLQGRSDEFTKKKPSERKQILASILNLDRYDRLADMARDRERQAADRARLAGMEVERLKAALRDEPVWKAERKRIERDLRSGEAALTRLRGEENALNRKLAALDAQKQEADATRRSLDALMLRRRDDEAELDRLRQRIEEARTLLRDREQIERDHRRYQQLKKEEDDLVQKQHLFLALERQIAMKEGEIRDLRNELEKQILTMETGLRADRDRLALCEQDLIQAPILKRQLEGARQAQQQWQEMKERQDRCRALEARIVRLDQQIMKEEEALKEQLRLLEADVSRQDEIRASLAEMTAEQVRLCREKDRFDRISLACEETLRAGQALKEKMREREGHIEAKKTAREKILTTLQTFRATSGDTCPTCGTPLTLTHRKKVERHYEEEVARIDGELQELQQAMAQDTGERERLLERYRKQRAEVQALEQVPEQLAILEAQLTHVREQVAGIEEKRKTCEGLRTKLTTGAFAETVRVERETLKKDLESLAFDEKAFENLRDRAMQYDRFREQVERLEQVKAQKDQLEKGIQQKTQTLTGLHQTLDDGSRFTEQRKQIETLKSRLQEIGFDAQRLDRIRQDLRQLGDIGRRVSDLLNAETNSREWTLLQDQIKIRIAGAEEEGRTLSKRLAELEAATEEQAPLQTRLVTLQAAIQEAETEQQRLQGERGKLVSLLSQAARDRESLQRCNAERAEAEEERTTYKHLRAAFGRHGIPSLIIEETLPGIEERANELLDQLTEGRMHVHLDTLKDKKTGGTRETLDIIITDEQGVPRPYETFSGGEAFRVNFALRIALSRLLAERSGVSVRTLVVDEGFGTQDARGVENLVEAIRTIQDDFEKIIVITHLDQLKEAFPVRIEVEKHPVEGSRFNVIGV